MKLPLVYPIKDVSTVEVGIINMGIVRIMSNEEFRKSGDLPYQIVNHVCKDIDVEQIKKLSMVDANKIMFQAWKQTHGKSQYLLKQYCECGKLMFMNFDLDFDYERPSFYSGATNIESLDVNTLESRNYSVKLQPLPLKFHSESLKGMAAEDYQSILTTYLWSMVESIDGKTDIDEESIPVPLYKKMLDIVKDDIEKTNAALTQDKTCSCGKENNFVLSWMDGTFLQGE